MTLHDLVVAAGLFLSSTLIVVLASLWPTRRERCVLCLKQRIDAECSAACLRRCVLKPG